MCTSRQIAMAFPVPAFLKAFPREFVTLLLGPQWSAAAFPLRMLAPAMVVQAS
jgi:O-antigen/teichoic acid export membrane protein